MTPESKAIADQNEVKRQAKINELNLAITQANTSRDHKSLKSLTETRRHIAMKFKGWEQLI